MLKNVLFNKQFGDWKVIGDTHIMHNNQKHVLWLCRCKCGTERLVRSDQLVSGKSNGCGCMTKYIVGNRSRIHGYSGTSEYKIWTGMKDRCYNKNNNKYYLYGGRGIRVCERWLDKKYGFTNFLSDMGRRISPLHTLDRFPNKDGDYDTYNCRWATPEQQNRNTSRNRWIEYNGKTEILQYWANKFNARSCHINRMASVKGIHNTLTYYEAKSNAQLVSIDKVK